MYGIKFTSCGRIKENSIQGRISGRNDSRARELKLQLSERNKIVSELRKNPDVLKAMKYDIAIYQKAVQIFHQQKDAMKVDNQRLA